MSRRNQEVAPTLQKYMNNFPKHTAWALSPAPTRRDQERNLAYIQRIEITVCHVCLLLIASNVSDCLLFDCLISVSIWSCFAYVACLLPFLSTAYRIPSAESVTLFLSVWLMFHGFRVCRLLMLMFCYVCLMFVCICCRVYVFNAMCIHMCINVWFELFTLTCKFIRVPICALICELECDICVLIRVYYYLCICLCIDCVFCT